MRLRMQRESGAAIRYQLREVGNIDDDVNPHRGDRRVSDVLEKGEMSVEHAYGDRHSGLSRRREKGREERTEWY